VPDTGNDKDRDPPELAALLELLHRGGASFTTVRATYRTWRHHERLTAAFRADIEEQKRNSSGASFSTVSARSSAPAPAEQEEILRIWRDGDRIRQEREGGGWLDGAYGVRSGDLWWSWNSHMGALSNQDNPKFGSSSIGEELAVMLDPTPLLGALNFAAVGRSTIAERATLTAHATARPSQRGELRSVLHQLGSGADHYTLEIDVDRGVLLEAAAFRDGKPFHRIRTVEVVFDHPIADERFRFEPPAGEEIQPISGPPRPQRLSLPEAQRRAPFTVLIPDRIPANWHVLCVFLETATRPPRPATVSLNYRSADGHESVSLSESSATDRPSGYEQLTSSDAWQDVERDGTVVRVTKPDAFGPPAQAHLERDGTFVILTSETLNSDQLATLAAGLKAAPTTGSIQ
jgi:hypothetical protein